MHGMIDVDASPTDSDDARSLTCAQCDELGYTCIDGRKVSSMQLS